MIMNSKLARSLVSAVAVGVLSLGTVACGGQEEEKKEKKEKSEKMKTEQKTKT